MPKRSAFPSGIDVASHQGAVAWPTVAAAGYTFGWTKASGGAWYVNPTLQANWHGMKAAGLARGAYHYAFESSGQPYPGPGAEAEADYFCSALEPLGIEPGDMVALDIEEGPNGPLGDWALAWLRRVESRLGFKPLVYTGAWFADPHGFGLVPQLAEYGLWIAAYQASMPSPIAPWPVVAFWQWTDRGVVSGVNGPCDLDLFNGPAENLALYGKPDSAPQPPPVSTYAYDMRYPGITQEESFDCSETSALWSLRSWGVDVDEEWLESSMMAEGVMSADLGLLDASGAGLADYLNRHFGVLGFTASNDGDVSWDDVLAEVTSPTYPTMLGGRAWGHWTACRTYDPSGILLLANPAPGYKGVSHTLSRDQFDSLGAFSLVRLRNPTAEGTPDGGASYAPPGSVGSGLLELMAADGTQPACPSTFLPLGASPATIEQCTALTGTVYAWHLPTGRSWVYPPSSS